jgi:hypothetical protein
MKDNLATRFLLPLLGMPKEVIRDTVKSKRRIINCFLFDENVEAYKENHLFVVHKNFQDVNFNSWDAKLIGQEHCVDAYDILDGQIGIKVFTMEPYEDYFKFLQGKYSQYSDWGKNRVTEFGVDSGLIAKQIIEKSDSLKKVLAEKYEVDVSVFDQECAPIWNSAEISNIIDESTMEYLKGLVKFKVKSTYHES